MTRAELGQEWVVCAACGKAAWVYSVVETPKDALYRGQPVKAGSVVHRAHETLWNETARQKLRAFQAQRGKP